MSAAVMSMLVLTLNDPDIFILLRSYFTLSERVLPFIISEIKWKALRFCFLASEPSTDTILRHEIQFDITVAEWMSVQN
jgi:hypothetical protein